MAVTITKKPQKYDRILGVDISTKTGLALFAGDELLRMETMHHKVQKPRDLYQQFDRWRLYRQQFAEYLLSAHVDLAVIESYGFASQSLGTLVEVGTTLRWCLHDAGIPWITITPNGLKKFCTGKGAGEKNLIMVEAYKRFGIDTKDDNQCDAALLAYVGAALTGRGPTLPKVHLDALKDPGLQLAAIG